VVVLNVINWNWEMILDMPANKRIQDAWTGEWFNAFFAVSVMYFLIDLVWICLVPSCVRSPATIIQHHVATLVYLLVPYAEPNVQWCMGACMSVEINTWFLIARRVFNKQGFSPWVIGLPPFVSIRVKLISIFFYLTWVSIRCILYPHLLLEFYRVWSEYSVQVGSKINVITIVLPLHAIFCLLNIKWTYDLIMSKLRYIRRKGNKHQISKGL
jgi:TLC domain